MKERVYLTHFSRGDSYCPLCGSSLVWRCVGHRKYTPCDKMPVLCAYDPESRLRVVYRGEIISGVKILNKENAAEFVDKKVFYALQPHVFTCSVMHQYSAFGRFRDVRAP